MQSLIWIAIVLVVIWVVARLVAGVAGVLLNLLWIIAIILLIVWLFNLVTGGSGA